MSTPRRRLIRPTAVDLMVSEDPQRRIRNVRLRLDRARTSIARGRRRLKRAFNAIARHEKASVRLERQVAKLEESRCRT